MCEKGEFKDMHEDISELHNFGDEADASNGYLKSEAATVKDKDYFNIVILGRPGQGKSTTANKLLGINKDCTTKTTCSIKEWTCEADPRLLKNSNMPEGALLSFNTGDDHHSVTNQCQMLSNEDTCIRVLDVIGFGGTSVNEKSSANIGIIHSVFEIQKLLDIAFNLVIYFLPFRGKIKHIQNYFQYEITTLFYHFEHANFEHIAIIAIQEEEYQAFEFTSEMLKELESLVSDVLKRVSWNTITCLPIIYIPLGMSPEDLLHHVRTARSSNLRNGEVDSASHKILPYREEGLSFIHKVVEAIQKRPTSVYSEKEEEFKKRLYKNSFDSIYNLMEGKLKDIGQELSLLSAGAQGMTLNCFLSTKGIEFNITPRTTEEAIFFLAALGCIPEVFHGVIGWEKWTKDVERFISSTTYLQYDEILRCIQTQLSGEALKIFVSMLEDRKIDFGVLIENYLKKLFDHWLHHRQKSKSETWNSYAQDFMSLAKKIHLEQVEKVVLEHILTQAGEVLKSIHWNSLDDAVDTISAAEEMQPFSNSSNEDWEEWREKFEHIAQNHKLNDSRKMICLGNLLSGNALKTFNDLNRDVHEYPQMMDSLTKAIYIEQFKSSKRNMTHTWGKYATELLSLVHKAYPEREDQEKIVLNYMLSQVSEENRSKPWKSLSEAVSVMSEDEIPVYANEEGEWWEEWMKTFQEFIDKHSLDNTNKLEWLTCRLIRSAKTIFDEMHTEDNADYGKTIICLGKKLYDNRYVCAKRDPQKGLHEYARYLLLLVQRIHPEMSETNQEQVVYARIVSEVSEPHELKQWTCLDEAVDVILAKEQVPVYSDQEDWNQWKAKFQSAAAKHSLNNTRKMLWLSCLLSGEAKRVFDALLEEDKKEYDFAIVTIERNLYASRFRNRNKKDWETWKTLRIELYSLAKDCYPGTSSTVLDQIVLKQLCSIIRGKDILLFEEPASLDDAVLTASAFEAIPTPYSDDMNWGKWIKIFENSLHARNVTDNDTKLRYLQLRLTGKASYLLPEIARSQRNYSKVKECLGVEIYRDMFERRQLQFGETWKKYTDELRKLGKQIYPPDQLDKCLLNKILSDPRACEIKYSGDDCKWDAWISNFDQIVHSCSLDDDAMLKWFDASLVEKARTMFDYKIPMEHKVSYPEAKKAMEKEINTILFHREVRGVNESVQSFVSRLEIYARKAFPCHGAEKMILEKMELITRNEKIETQPLFTFSEAVVAYTALDEMGYHQYHNGEDWELWLSHFEDVAARNGLKEAEKLLWLKACLTGNALDVFNTYFSPESTFESIKGNIRIAQIVHQQIQQGGRTSTLCSSELKPALKKCTKCSGNHNEPMCHTMIVPLSVATSGIMKGVHKIEELMYYTDKVCMKCGSRNGTKGCTLIGTGVQHNC